MTETIVKQKPVHDENYWMTVLLYFASFLVGLGIISLVAANWQQIPNMAKMVGALVLMVINAAAIWWTMKTDKPILKQVLSVVYAFLIMAVIGLIGQIFQLRADVAKACLSWSLLSWPLFLIVPRLLWLWVPMLFFGLHYLPPMFISEIQYGIFGESGSGALSPLAEEWYLAFSTIAIYSLILAYEFWLCLQKEPNKIVTNPLRFYCGVVLWGLCSRAAEYALKNPQITVGCVREILVPCILVGMVVFAINKLKGRKSFMPLFLGAAVMEYLYVFTYQHFQVRPSYLHDWYGNRTEIWLPLMFLLSISTYAFSCKMKRLFRLSMVAMCGWFGWTFCNDIFDLIPSLIVCGFAAFWAYKAKSRRWFNIAVMAAVLRILGYYGDVSNLTYFGIYLICSGLLVIVTILLLMKYGKKLWEKSDEK